MKFKEFHLKDARASHLKIQYSKDLIIIATIGARFGTIF